MICIKFIKLLSYFAKLKISMEKDKIRKKKQRFIISLTEVP